MDFRSLLRRYQSYDPATGAFSLARNDSQYARLLGVQRALLSRFYAGHVEDSHTLLTAFLRTFPEAASAVARALNETPIAAEVA